MLKLVPVNFEQLAVSIGRHKKLVTDLPSFESRFSPLEESYKTLAKFDAHIPEDEGINSIDWFVLFS